MYSRDIGFERLTKLQKEMMATLPASEYRKGIYIDIPIRYFGMLPPEEKDIIAFNSCIPHFELSRTHEGVYLLRSFGIKNKTYFSDVNLNNGERHCIEQAYHFANTFLISLSMATLSFILWKQISLPGLMFHGTSLLKNQPLKFSFEPIDLQMTNQTLYPLHAGQLIMAYEAFSELNTWHQKFINCYSKGQTLLNSPRYEDMNFYDESYMNYFRCLEYVVMDKVLGKRGDFTDHTLADALLKLEFAVGGEISRKNAYALSKKLNALRGTAAAHLTRSNLNSTGITAQEVYELKTLVDSVTVIHINKTQNAKAVLQKKMAAGFQSEIASKLKTNEL